MISQKSGISGWLLDNFKNFDNAWKEHGKTYNTVLVNSVAASCIDIFCTTVDTGKFNQVFSWFISEGIIPNYSDEKGQWWFSKNIFLTKIIKEKFADELKNKTTDELYLRMFIWEIYLNISYPFSLNKLIVNYGSSCVIKRKDLNPYF
ncbi:MAG: hypothetical protein OXH65_00370 [Paracoccaceae bacterium]|nr:hypothetical protein [Paracoccaceae bacterium]MDE2673545.1 hypothetical protein [Paracoccaceae bacterium]